MKSVSVFTFLFLLALLPYFSEAQGYDPQSKNSSLQRPRIGVTLSGGGARGLAHIGILKALDSAGLKVDFVTGTSMGSVVGALYAAGYTAKEIEQIALKINWDLLFTNRSSLQSFIIEEKSEYQKYAVELPWENKKFKLAGVLESQELWLKFSELFFPVYAIKDFSQLPKGFICIGADISTGQPVSLKKGELVSSVRASMAIPSIFKPVELDGIKLVDGGIVRNFPVSEVREMGADFVVGSNVSGDLLTTEKIDDLFQVITQITTFREDEDQKRQRALCNIYYYHALPGFGTSSFSSAEDIIKLGIENGNALYPQFKKVADSLNAIYGPPTAARPRFHADSVRISDFEVRGLKATKPKFFFQRSRIEKNKWYTSTELAEGIRKAFGTRYYSKIIYSFHPLPDGSAKIIYDVEENPLTFIKLILNYNSFQGVGLVANITSRNILTDYSRSMLTVNIGDNLKLRGEHLQLLGNKKNISANAEVLAEVINEFPLYTNFVKHAIYRQSYLKADITAGSAYNRKFFMGLGTRFEALHYTPDLTSDLEIRGRNTFLNSYAVIRFNTLTNSIYPKRGTKIELEGGYIYNQKPDFRVFDHGQPVTNIDSLGFGTKPFSRIKLNVEHYIPFAQRFSLLTQSQVGINFTKKENLSNDFFIGGLTSSFRNQIVFAGLREATVFQEALLLQDYQSDTGLFPTCTSSATSMLLSYNFTGSKELNDAKWLTGYGLTFAVHYLGPLQVSVMYCDQFKKFFHM